LKLGLDLWVTHHPPYYPVQGAKVSKKVRGFVSKNKMLQHLNFGGNRIKEVSPCEKDQSGKSFWLLIFVCKSYYYFCVFQEGLSNFWRENLTHLISLFWLVAISLQRTKTVILENVTMLKSKIFIENEKDPPLSPPYIMQKHIKRKRNSKLGLFLYISERFVYVLWLIQCRYFNWLQKSFQEQKPLLC
jgi:hypothetical protein